MSDTPGAVAIETSRLHLEPFRADHVDFLHRLWTEPEVRKYLWDDRVIARDEAVEIVRASGQSFARAGYGFWVLDGRRSGEPIGFAGLRDFGDPPEVELFYALLPAWWGKGLATEASRAVLHHGFDACALPRIWAGADLPNARSFQVMERLGMRRAGPRTVYESESFYYVLDRASAPGADIGGRSSNP